MLLSSLTQKLSFVHGQQWSVLSVLEDPEVPPLILEQEWVSCALGVWMPPMTCPLVVLEYRLTILLRRGSLHLVPTIFLGMLPE